ncbi:MAG: gliding motility-associated lipoprotein GldJ [Bacteroidetes bacterium]|nr:MAG: gliding motility-associated lipoprotein GldJ [Bacteroidota bacterium]
MKKAVKPLLLIAGGAMIMASCQKERSNVTGWNYNDRKNGGFEVVPYEEQETGPGLVFIEGGTFTMGRVEQDVTFDWNHVPRRVTVSSFYLDETEVRNLDYLEYLYWTARVFGANYPEIYTQALPDTLVWREKLAYNEPYVTYYLRHPAYRDYPVVGVNWLQASDFCNWRSDRVNEFILIREGILEFAPDQRDGQTFNTDRYLTGMKATTPYVGAVVQNIPSLNPDQETRMVRMEDGILLPKYRLPTEAEWEYASFGLIGNTIGERITDRRLYPWNGHAVRNPDERYLGQMLANYKRSNGDNMGTAGMLNDAGDITTPVYSYWPNDYGLYNMAGNVSEWVMDVYRPSSLTDDDDFRSFRGNVFTTQKRADDDPNLILVNEDSVLRDKDSNIVSIPGTIRSREVNLAYKEDKLDKRRNYKYADNISFKDGDGMSSIYYVDPTAQQPNKLMYEYGITSMLNDKARVYKGGSWKDRAYWMVPGTRRYLDQNQATAFLGFRCAMDRVGSPVGLGK